MVAARTCPFYGALKDAEQPSTHNGKISRTSGMRARQDASPPSLHAIAHLPKSSTIQMINLPTAYVES